MTDRDRTAVRLLGLVAILFLAFGLRLYRLGAESLWYDETVSAQLAGKRLPDLVAYTAGDIHPPGYYVLLRVWTRMVGESDFALAFFSLAFGVLLVALVYKLGARVFGIKAGVLAALLVAISPYNIWYSQEVRMYTLGSMLGMLVLSAVMALMTRLLSGRSAKNKWLTLYAVCGALGLWTLYYFAFLLVAVNLMVGLWWFASRRRGCAGWGWLVRWGLAQAAVLVLYAPWIPVAWRQATNPPVPPWRGILVLREMLVETWSALCLGQSVDPIPVWPALLVFTVVFGLGLVSRWLRPRLQGWLEGGESLPSLLVGYTFIPMLLVYVVSCVTPLYHVRYMFTYSTPFYIILGSGLAWLWQRWRLAAWASLAVIVVASGISVHAYHTDPRYASDDHRAAVGFLADRWRPGDAILVNAGYVYTALATYWDGDPISWRGRLVGEWPEGAPVELSGPAVFQTGTVDGDLSLGWGRSDSDFYAMSRMETAEALGRLFADSQRVWVYRIYDTVTDPDGFIRQWLEGKGIQFEDQLFTGEANLRVQGYLTGREGLAGVRPVEAGLADGCLRLMGSTALPTAVEVGGALDLALLWQVGMSCLGEGASSLADEAILFAGFFDTDGRSWAQTDEHPLGSLYPVEAWSEGEMVRTPLRILVPPGTPPGSYRLEVGWYRFVDGQPVWLPWTSGEREYLGELEVVAPTNWSALPLPEMGQPLNVLVGEGVRLLGFDAPSPEGHPGDVLDLEFFWQASEDRPEAGPAVLQLQDDSGQVLAEASSAPVGGQAPFAGLQAGQSVRDPRSLTLPAGLPSGVYNLVVGRRQASGMWLPVCRGFLPLGSAYPLATVRVLGRSMNLTPPRPQHALQARFGEGIRLVGYDLETATSKIQLTLYWQALASMTVRYKIFVHLVGDGGPVDIRAQADSYPRLPTTAWLSGEYQTDLITLHLPASLLPGRYTLLVGWYEEASGHRLPAFLGTGESVGDSLALEHFDLGE
jgi:4-amino-4-deoxy-L-arabinose transferase-like glycosyltransferase